MELKPRSKTAKDAEDRIWEHLLTLHRGDLLTYDAMESLTGLVKDVAPWGTILRRLERRLLRERNIAWQNEVLVGYRLCHVSEQIRDQTVKRTRRARRQLHRAAENLEVLPAEEMSLHQQVVRANLLQGVKESQERVSRNARIVNALMKPNDSKSDKERPT